MCWLFLHAASPYVHKTPAKWRVAQSLAGSVRGSMRPQLAVLPFLALSVAAVSMDQGNRPGFELDAINCKYL